MADVLTLECYRVVLLQQRPLITPASLLDVPIPTFDGDECFSETFLWHQLALMEARSLCKQPHPGYIDIACLSAATRFSLGSYSGEAYEALDRPWNPATVYAALVRLFEIQGDLQDHRHLLLYHANATVLYAPLEELREIFSCIVARRVISSALSKVLHNWQRSCDCVVAVEHALCINSIGEHTFGQGTRDNPTTAFAESPHDAFCVYLGAVLSWFETSDSITDDPSTSRFDLNKAIRISSQLRATISAKMKHVLNELGKKEP